MTLPVKEMVAAGTMYHTECIYCGSCVDACPRNAIAYRWGRPPGDSAGDSTQTTALD